MDSISPSARTYRWLGSAALAHAALVLGLGHFAFPIFFQGHWAQPLWVGAVTLWFFWPIILALHAGRSWLRFTLFMFVGLLILSPSLFVYNSVAPRTFGLPWIVRMNPLSISIYYRAYLAGGAEAKRDISAGILAIAESGFGAGGGPAVDILRERYHVEVRALAQCLVDETIIGHEDGYNSVAGPEIDRRIGRDKIEAAREEGHRIAQARFEAAERLRKDLAKRFSIFPNDSRIRLESVSPYIRDGLDLPPAVENDLGDFVRAVEQFVRQRIPEDSPAFELHISANLARSSPPKYQTSASGSAPRPVYDSIHKEIDSLSVGEWNNEDSAVSLDFAIGQQAD